MGAPCADKPWSRAVLSPRDLGGRQPGLLGQPSRAGELPGSAPSLAAAVSALYGTSTAQAARQRARLAFSYRGALPGKTSN